MYLTLRLVLCGAAKGGQILNQPEDAELGSKRMVEFGVVGRAKSVKGLVRARARV